MSTLRTTNSSHLSDKDSTISAYSVYKKLTQGNKTLERTLHPSNLLFTHYKPYNFPKKDNRTEWLDNKKGKSLTKEFDGKMFSRKIKPDPVTFMLEMKYDLVKPSKISKTRHKSPMTLLINTSRTINPEKDTEYDQINKSCRKGKKILSLPNRDNKIKNLLNHSALISQNPEIGKNRKQKNVSFITNFFNNKSKKVFK